MEKIDRQTLRAILMFEETHRYPPSVADIAALIKRTTTPTYQRLLRLKVLGLVTWEPGRARTLRILPQEGNNVEPKGGKE